MCAVFGPMARITAIGSTVLKTFVKNIIRDTKSNVTESAVTSCVPPARQDSSRRTVSARLVKTSSAAALS